VLSRFSKWAQETGAPALLAKSQSSDSAHRDAWESTLAHYRKFLQADYVGRHHESDLRKALEALSSCGFRAPSLKDARVRSLPRPPSGRGSLSLRISAAQPVTATIAELESLLGALRAAPPDSVGELIGLIAAKPSTRAYMGMDKLTQLLEQLAKDRA
jgi:hypothetical protein